MTETTETNDTNPDHPTRKKTKAERQAEAPRMTPKQQRRHIQLLRTQELATLKLIEDTSRNTLSALTEVPFSVQAFVLDIKHRMDRELIRLRRALISERTHRQRFALGILPRLKSKVQEVRNLREQLSGLKEKARVEKSVARAKARAKARRAWTDVA